MISKTLNIFFKLVATFFLVLIFAVSDKIIASNSFILTSAWKTLVVNPKMWVLYLFILFSISLIFIICIKKYQNLVLKFLNLIDFKKIKFEYVLVPTIGFIVYLINTKVFFGRPHIIDSIVQLYQAKLFLSAYLSLPLPQDWYFFFLHNMLITESFWASQYLPGQSLVLALGYLINNISLIPAFLAIISCFYLFKFSKLAFDLQTARVTILLLTISPFFLFLGSTFKEHITTFTLLSAFSYYSLNWIKYNRKLSLLLSAFFLGLCLNVRPLNAIIFGCIFLIPSFRNIIKNRSYFTLFLSIILGLLCLSPTFFYNYEITDSIFKTGFIENWGSGHKLGFHFDPWGNSFSLKDGVIHQLMNLTLFNDFVFFGLVPALLPISIFFILNSKFNNSLSFFFLAFLVTPIVFIFYWHTDFYLGPRFLYESLIFYLPLTAHILIITSNSLKNKFIKRFSLELLFKISLIITLIFQLGFGIYPKAKMYKQSMGNFKFSLSDLIKEEKITKGLIFVKVSWGSRMISKLRSYNIPTHEVEILYKNIDHCKLHHWLIRVENKKLPKSEVYDEFKNLYKNKREVPIVKLNGDSSLRLNLPLSLSTKCKLELFYDSKGIDIFAPYMLINEVNLRGDIVVAKDLKDWNTRLTSNYKGYPVYYFVNKKLYSDDQFKDYLNSK